MGTRRLTDRDCRVMRNVKEHGDAAWDAAVPSERCGLLFRFDRLRAHCLAVTTNGKDYLTPKGLVALEAGCFEDGRWLPGS